MSTPSYVTLISGVVDSLKDYSELTTLVSSSQIYYGGPEQQALLSFPSITVELTEANETDIAMPARKELAANFVITAYDASPDYITGIQNVQNIVKRIDDALQVKYTIDGQAIYSQVTNRSFLPGEYDTIPIMACRLSYTARVRFVRAS